MRLEDTHALTNWHAYYGKTLHLAHAAVMTHSCLCSLTVVIQQAMMQHAVTYTLCLRSQDCAVVCVSVIAGQDRAILWQLTAQCAVLALWQI